MLEKQEFSPMYKQVARYLREQIISKNIPALSKMPPERDIAEKLSINRITLRKALEILSVEGLVVREHGKGTYVTDTENKQSLSRKTIGLVFTWASGKELVNDPYASLVTKGVGSSLNERYDFAILGGFNVKKLSDLYYDYKMNGMIIDTPAVSRLTELENLKKSGIPFIITDAEFKGTDLDYVAFDNEKASINAINYLFGLGHRDIAYVSQRLDTKNNIDRFNGYRKGLEKNGLKFRKEFVFLGRESGAPISESFQSTDELLDQNRPTAILCSMFSNTLGVLKAIEEKKLKVPEDISVMGFDDPESASHIASGITSIRLPIEKMCGHAVEELCKRVNSGTKKPFQVLYEPELIIRNTCSFSKTGK